MGGGELHSLAILWEEKEHKSLKMHSSMGELPCRFGHREVEKTRFLTPRQYSQLTFVVRTAIHIFHELHDFSQGLQASYVISS